MNTGADVRSVTAFLPMLFMLPHRIWRLVGRRLVHPRHACLHEKHALDWLYVGNASAATAERLTHAVVLDAG